MLRKFTHFKFDGPLHKEKNVSHKKGWEYQLQIILIGSKSEEVLAEMKLLELSPNVTNEMFAIRMEMRGHLDIKTSVSADLSVHYDETRKHNTTKNEVVFEHQDNIETTSNLHNTSQRCYQSCKPDFLSDQDILIVLAGNDKEEETRLIKETSQKTGECKNIYVTNAHFPDKLSRDGFPSWKIGLSSDAKIGSNIPLSCDFENNQYAESYAKSVKRRVDDIATKFVENLTADIEGQIKGDVIKGIADELHQQADEHFAKPFYKR